MTSELVTVYLSLGSNLGDRQANLQKALQLISRQMQVGLVSSIYETEPVGNTDQPLFLNLVCQVFTRLSAEDLLVLFKGFEALLGRAPHTSNAPRPIDIDILFYGDEIIETESLTIPHPRLAERAFVLVPLAEIALDLVHPVSGRTVSELLKRLTARQGVAKWESKEAVQ